MISDFCVGETTPVCSYPTGNTAQGLCDMAGNAIEWMEDDWHENYEGAPADGSAWVENPRRSDRINRGGAWSSNETGARAAYRFPHDQWFSHQYYGFRLARTPARAPFA